MPSTLHLENGDTLNVNDSIAEARAKVAKRTFQPFVTTFGNNCKVNCTTVTKITPLKA